MVFNFFYSSFITFSIKSKINPLVILFKPAALLIKKVATFSFTEGNHDWKQKGE